MVLIITKAYLIQYTVSPIIYADFSSYCCYVYVCILTHTYSASEVPLGKTAGQQVAKVLIPYIAVEVRYQKADDVQSYCQNRRGL